MSIFFETEKVTEHITRLTDITRVSMFLAVGEREAALIDTGTGIGNLKEAVKGLTEKPVKVLLTHGHLDHAFGASAFETIYMNPLDKWILDEHGDMQMRFDYVKNSPLPEGTKLTADMFAPKPEFTKMIALKDGDVFDLGGLTIEIYALPGHTPGSMAVLFREERLLLTGDACNPGTWIFAPGCPSVEEYRDTLVTFRERTRGKYDRILLSHGNSLLESELLDVVIETCGRVLNGTDDAIRSEFLGMEVYSAAETEMTQYGPQRLDGKIGNIIYNRNNIYRH